MAAKGPGPQQLSWPTDEDGRAMAIVFSSAGEVVKTQEYCNVQLGPTGAMVPVKNDPEEIERTQREMQQLAQYILGTERRSIQWSMDPSLKPLSPDEIKDERAEEVVKES